MRTLKTLAGKSSTLAGKSLKKVAKVSNNLKLVVIELIYYPLHMSAQNSRFKLKKFSSLTMTHKIIVRIASRPRDELIWPLLAKLEGSE